MINILPRIEANKQVEDSYSYKDELVVYSRYLSFCTSTLFHLSGPDSEEFEHEVWSEIREIGRSISKIGGAQKLKSVFNSLSVEEQSMVYLGWAGLENFE